MLQKQLKIVLFTANSIIELNLDFKIISYKSFICCKQGLKNKQESKEHLKKRILFEHFTLIVSHRRILSNT